MIGVEGGASGDAAGIFDDEPMCMHRVGLGLLGDGEHRVPVAGVDARQPEVGGDLAEAHRPCAPIGVAADLGDREVDVPQGDQAQRDEVAVGVGAPLLDHVVVVRLHAGQAEVEVVALHERLAAEARERRERDRPVDPGRREVLDAGLAARSTRVACRRR